MAVGDHLDLLVRRDAAVNLRLAIAEWWRTSRADHDLEDDDFWTS
jgi:hypothetical protein